MASIRTVMMMPEGYKCDLCREFYQYTHSATRINFGEILNQTGEVKAPEKIVCHNCAQALWVTFLDNGAPPRDAVDSGHSKIEVTGE